MRNLFFLTFVLAALTGCQPGWDKDPTIEGLPPEVEQGPETYMAAMRDAIYILNDNFYDFVEGESGRVEFEIKVLQPDIINVEAGVDGLEDYLPGATQTFDPATGKFLIEWDVPQVFVRGLESGYASYQLRLVVNTTSQDGSKAQREQPIEFRIIRKLERPEILRVTPPDKQTSLVLKEGSSGTYTVVVKDPNSSNGSMTVAEPILMVEPPASSTSKSGAHLVSVASPTRDPNNPTLWNFRVTVRTFSEMTASSDTLFFTLRAYTPLAMSAEQVRSAAYPVSFRVENGVTPVEWTGSVLSSASKDADARFWEGTTNYFTFAFYDPRGEARAQMLALDSKCNAGGTAPRCECKLVTDRQVCTLHWVPSASDADPKGDVLHEFKFRAQTVHKTNSKEMSNPKEFTLKINVSSRPPGI